MIDPIAWLKGALFRVSAPLFFKEVGPGCLYYGRVRVPILRNIKIGARCMIGDSVYLSTGRASFIEVGDECSINSGTHIVASERIKLGRGVAIGEFVSIRDQDHRFVSGVGVRETGYIVRPVEIGNYCWIGRGVFIGPGVELGEGSIVAANSVVLAGSYPAGVLLAGAPAVIKKRIDVQR